MATKRRIHLGIDYGTSSSKIVFRDYGAPGGEVSYVVLRGGSFRIPSRVCVMANELLFGNDSKTSEECDIYESIKMRVAAEITGDPRYYFGPLAELPKGLTAPDLAALSVWHLISEGYRAVLEYVSGDAEGIAVGMTMGVPMAFFKDAKLKMCFLTIARKAWALYRNEGPTGSTLLLDKALRLLEKYSNIGATAIPDYEIREWIRSEAEAAMWWPFQSPAIGAGPYAKVDIGAGTTHASLYRIFSGNGGVKKGLAFFGAVSVSVGMDAVDRAIADSQNLGGDCLSLRGLEETILKSDGKARGALIPVADEIYEPYRRAWIETHRKINQTIAELKAWQNHRVFVIGGGSLISNLVQRVRIHPGRGDELRLAVLEPPGDLLRSDNNKVSKDELPFVIVAYGLSNIGLSIPEAFTPDQIPPLPDMRKERQRLDANDIYAK